MIFVHRPQSPFWRTVAPEEITENPLGYRCASNAADAHYAGARRIEEFIAFGFGTCWLSPDDFTLWWRLEVHDICWLREYLLRVLEDTLLLWYSEGDEWELPMIDFDVSDDACLIVGNADAGEDEEVTFRWWPTVFNEEVLAMSLQCSGTEDYTIWLDRKAINQDRTRIRCAIAWARRLNIGPHVMREAEGVNDSWERLRVPFIEPPTVNSCFTFGEWWDKRADGTST
jgi:hypothetical protein